jgi:pilus assembly protein CpaC
MRHAFAAALALILGLAGMQPKHAAAATVLLSDNSKHAGEFVVPLNKSQILRLDTPFSDLLIGNPDIIDVLTLTDQSVYVLGKALGATSLMIYGRDKALLAVLDVVVSPDVEGLKAKLHELVPDEAVEVRALNGAIVLSGTVSGAGRMAKVLAIAERFAPNLVTNLMTVRGSQQVMLKVRFVEVSRTALKQLGLNFDAFDGDFSFTSGDTFLANPGVLAGAGGAGLLQDAFGTGLFTGNAGTVGLRILFEALETKGMARTLAEPNLIALSGDTASFLAGGEFPIEVAQSGASATGEAAITIEFKEFGISLSFTPTVLDDGLINLVVSPEVSALDFSAAVRGTPGLTTRRATTTVELRDGQAFAIAGLLQQDFQDAVRQVPMLGDIPVLGALFRSSGYQRKETELVIIVEPHLVQPAPAGALATPADFVAPPRERDLWLRGRIDAPGPGLPTDPAAALSAAGAGGLSGKIGYILK